MPRRPEPSDYYDGGAMTDQTPAEPQALSAKEADRAARSSRIILRLPRLITEADDYSWVPLGEVLMAIVNPDHAELGYPEGTKPAISDVLLRAASRESVGAGLDGATLDWFDELVAGAPHMTPKGWIHLSPVEVSRLAAIVATARLAAAPHPVADTETEGRTPCPVCPHWMEVHNDDGTCGCGAHG